MRIVDQNNPGPPAFEASFRRLASSEEPMEAKVGTMMLALLDHLRNQGDEPTVFGFEMYPRELWLIVRAKDDWAASLKITIDFIDRSPLVEGVPVLHYRLSYQPPSPSFTSHPKTLELRTRQMQEAADFIVDVITKYQDHRMED